MFLNYGFTQSFVSLFVYFLAIISAGQSQKPDVIRVMTFNTWQTGGNVENGLTKIVKHILYNYPDIVALEEVFDKDVLMNLTRLLGPEWSNVGRNMSRPDASIVTRHKIFHDPEPVGFGQSEENGSIRAKIQVRLNNKGRLLNVSFWAAHLDYHDYGPYACCNKMVTNKSQIDAGEHYIGGDVPGRIENIRAITSDASFQDDVKISDQDPLMFLGDLNTPSHVDYTEATKPIHCGWAYQWPVTKTLMSFGLKDAFRVVHPDPLAVPGNTWSTAQKFQDGWGMTIPEPQDRIDIVLYKSKLLTPVQAIVYSGSEPIMPEPFHWKNDWPSDHASVVVDFVVNSVE